MPQRPAPSAPRRAAGWVRRRPPPVRLAASAAGAPVLAVLVGADDSGGPLLSRAAAEALTAAGLDPDRVVARARATTTPGEAVAVPLLHEGPREAVVLVGCGGATPAQWRRAGAALARRSPPGAVDLVVGRVGGPRPAARVQALVEGWLLASYTPPRRPARAAEPRELVLVARAAADLEPAVRAAQTAAEATWLARDLTATPSDLKTPEWLADRALEVAAERGLTTRLWDVPALAADGFGGILGVGQGSARPPRLVQLGYRPAGSVRWPHVVLVGKGVTFDTGGISLKPAEAMVPMKTDMAGAGAVLAAMAALPSVAAPVRVTALLACAENMPSGAAQRPGDVLTSYGGRTVEVLNTDAEGRLVLADALAYADARLAPDALVDVATLTGAATFGLGRRHAALYATSDRLARGLETAAGATGERVWRMPLPEEYVPALASPVADLAHVPHQPAAWGGGSITAALFLRTFAGGRPWAHLDIAGTGRADADEHEVVKGATGYGARLLISWLAAGASGVRRAGRPGGRGRR